MDGFLKQLKKGFNLTALLSVVVGLLLLIYPSHTSALACYLLGGIIIIQGIVTLVNALSLMRENIGGRAAAMLIASYANCNCLIIDSIFAVSAVACQA